MAEVKKKTHNEKKQKTNKNNTRWFKLDTWDTREYPYFKGFFVSFLLPLLPSDREEVIAFQEIVNFSNTIFFRQHKWMTKLFFNNTKKVFICSMEYGLLLVLQDSWSLGLLVLETKWRSGMLIWQRVLRDVWGIVFRVTVEFCIWYLGESLRCLHVLTRGEKGN